MARSVCIIDMLDNSRKRTHRESTRWLRKDVRVSQDSILGTLFLVHVNNMPQAVKSNLFLYDSWLMSHVQTVMSKKLKDNYTRMFAIGSSTIN